MSRPVEPDRHANLRTGLILAAIAVALFFGVIVNHLVAK